MNASTHTTTTSTTSPGAMAVAGSDECDDADDELVIEELLVEEISIDGMCGVY